MKHGGNKMHQPEGATALLRAHMPEERLYTTTVQRHVTGQLLFIMT